MATVKTVLLYNPAAGTRRRERRHLFESAADHLRQRGFEPTLVPTTARGSAAQQARDAAAHGAQAIFACGGDGTIHEVLQGAAGMDVHFGILPFGSANALAHELRIPRDALQAARLYQPSCSISVPLAVVRRPALPDRYFLSMAGAGPDGALMYRMLTTDRSRWGRWTYYWHALRLFLASDLPTFQVRYQQSEHDAWQEQRCICAMALRIGNLGGLFRGIAQGASVRRDTMRLLLVPPPARFTLPLWFLCSWFGIARWNPLLTVADVQRLTIAGSTAHVQADGEWLGKAAAEIEMLPKTVQVLVPATAR